jgi:hypothetical protein
MTSPIDKAIAEMPAILRREARKARRSEVRRFVQTYDRSFSLPRVLLGYWADADTAVTVCAMDRGPIVDALRRAIRHHRTLAVEHRWYASRPMLEGARKVYVAERYAALRERASQPVRRAA